MKKTLMMIVVALMAAFAMQAQDHARHHGGPGRDMDPAKFAEMRVQQLDKELNLTAEQKTALTAIFVRQAEQMKAKREQMKQGGERPSREQMRAKGQQAEAEVEAVLTAEQKAKYSELKEQRRGHHGHRGHKAAPGRDGKAGCNGGCCGSGGCKKAEAQQKVD